MDKKDLKVGQEVFIAPYRIGRVKPNSCIHTGKITKVGRVWFTVKYDDWQTDDKFSIETMLQNSGGYAPSHKAYLSPKDIDEELESLEINTYLNRFFNVGKPSLSLDQLKRVKDIVDET